MAILRTQLTVLNGITFSDVEWDRFFLERVAGAGDGSRRDDPGAEDDVQLLARDDGSTRNVRLLDKVHVHSQPVES